MGLGKTYERNEQAGSRLTKHTRHESKPVNPRPEFRIKLIVGDQVCWLFHRNAIVNCQLHSVDKQGNLFQSWNPNDEFDRKSCLGRSDKQEVGFKTQMSRAELPIHSEPIAVFGWYV